VDQGDHVAGLLTLHDVKEIPRPSWTTTAAAQAMVPIDKSHKIDSTAELWSAMEKMSRDSINELPVMQGNTVVGLLSMADIVKYLQTMQQLSSA
jgi:signal-transduction protein with cAMP-binding, CBS, and nucleotidyltransferase domain